MFPEHSKHILKLFKQQSLSNDSAIIYTESEQAVVQSLSFIALDQMSSQLGHYLLDNGFLSPKEIDPLALNEPILAIRLSRESPWFTIAIFAAWKIGLGVVLLDKSLDPDVTYSRVCQTDCKGLLTDETLDSTSNLAKYFNGDGKIQIAMHTADTKKGIEKKATSWPEYELRPEQLAYVAFTSGTTSNPKAIAITHANLPNFILAIFKELKLARKSRVLQLASASFDAIWNEILLVATGCTLVLPDDAVSIYTQLDSFCNQHLIDFVVFVPSVLEKYTPKKFETLRAIISTGEAGNQALFDKWSEESPNHIHIVDGYGPTEATIGVTLHSYNRGEELHLGKLIPGCYLHTEEVKDDAPEEDYGSSESAESVEPVSRKELYIYGPCLGRGYIKNGILSRELTDAAFKTIKINGKDERAYHTGDEVRISGDKYILLGRSDRQVKPSGVRVELTAVEDFIRTSLQEHFTNGNLPIVHVVPRYQDTANANNQCQVKHLVLFIITETSIPNLTLKTLRQATTELPNKGTVFPPEGYYLSRQNITDFNLETEASKKFRCQALPALLENPEFTTQLAKIPPSIAVHLPAEKVLEIEFRNILANCFNVNPESIDLERDRFEDFGGNSLLAVALRNKICGAYPGFQYEAKVLGINFLFKDLLNSIARQKIFSSCRWHKVNHPTDPEALPLFLFHSITGIDNELLPLMPRDDDEMIRKWQIYVLQNPLAELPSAGSPDEKFYAFYRNNPCESLTVLAKYLRRSILTIQAHTPWFLGGYSFGSILAFYTAREFLANKQPPSFLGLLDSLPPAYCRILHRRAPKSLVAFVHYVIGTIFNGQGLSDLLSSFTSANDDDINFERYAEEMRSFIQSQREIAQKNKTGATLITVATVTETILLHVTLLLQGETEDLTSINSPTYHYRCNDTIQTLEQTTDIVTWANICLDLHERPPVANANHLNLLAKPELHAQWWQDVNAAALQFRLNEALRRVSKSILADLSQMDVQNENLYQPLHVTSDFLSAEANALQATFDYFLDDNEKQALLLLGQSGSGKTLFCIRQTIFRLTTWTPDEPFPLFIPLGNHTDNEGDLITQYLRNRHQLDDETIRLLKKHFTFIVFLDGYDEYLKKNKILQTGDISRWDAKFIITCRSQHLLELRKDYLSLFVPLDRKSETLKPQALQQLCIQPLLADQVINYITSYLKTYPSSWNLTQYQIALRQFKLIPFLQTPFSLSMIVSTLPELHLGENSAPSRAYLYERCIRILLQRELRSLQQRGLLASLENEVEDLAEEFFGYCQLLSLTLLERSGKIYGEFTHELPLKSIYQIKKSTSFSHSTADLLMRLLGDTDRLPTLIRRSAPIQPQGISRYNFTHLSIVEFYIALFLRDELLSPNFAASSSRFNLHSLVTEQGLLDFLADWVKTNEQLKTNLLELVGQTKANLALQIAGENAITLLNHARINLSGYNFSGINVPNARLRGLMAQRSAFIGANLSKADLSLSVTLEANFENADLSGAYLGQTDEYPVAKELHDTVPTGMIIDQQNNLWLTTESHRISVKLWKRLNGTSELNCVSEIPYTINPDDDTHIAYTLDRHTNQLVIALQYQPEGANIETIMRQQPWDEEIDTTERFTPLSSQTNSFDFDYKYHALIVFYSLSEGRVVRKFHVANVRTFSYLQLTETNKIFLYDRNGILAYIDFNSLFSKAIYSTIEKLSTRSLHCIGECEFSIGNSAEFFVAFFYDNLYLWHNNGSSPALMVSLPYKEENHDLGRRFLRFSPKDQHLLAIGLDGYLAIWDARSNTLVTELADNDAIIIALTFSHPNGLHLATLDAHGIIRVWDTKTWCLTFLTTTKICYTATRLAFDSSETILTVYDRLVIRTYDVKSAAYAYTTSVGHSNVASSIVLSPDGRFAAASDHPFANFVRVWDTLTHHCIATSALQSLNFLTFRSNGSLIGVGNSPDGIRRYVWQAPDFQPVVAPEPIDQLRNNDDKPYAREVYVRMINTKFPDCDINPYSIEISQGGKYFACITQDSTNRIFVCNLASHKIFQLPLPLLYKQNIAYQDDRFYQKSNITSLLFSADNKLLAAGTKEGKLLVWRLNENSAEIYAERIIREGKHIVVRTFIDSNTLFIFSSSKILYVKLTDTNDEANATVTTYAPREVRDIAYHPATQLVVTTPPITFWRLHESGVLNLEFISEPLLSCRAAFFGGAQLSAGNRALLRQNKAYLDHRPATPQSPQETDDESKVQGNQTGERLSK